MYERYHIETSPAKLSSTLVGKFRIIRDDQCLNCGRCATLCIYGVHERDSGDPRKMSEPESHLCKNCFSCIQNCPRQALRMVKNEEFEKLGNSYWTPDMIHTIWNEAEEGRIPVHGAGYRGPFKGAGFDRIWTDMSEIVRPTRDGIHGREYIATAVDLGRKVRWIEDFKRVSLPKFYEIEIPMLLDTGALGLNSKNIILATIKASHQLGTLALLNIENYLDEMKPYLCSIALRFAWDKIELMDPDLSREVNFIEITLPGEFSIAALEEALEKIKSQNQSALISLGLKYPYLAPGIIKQFEEKRADVLSFYADDQGLSPEQGFFISDSIRKLHLDCLKRRFRDEITLTGRGGIAAAEHVPKLIICGADAVVLDLALLVAVGCRVCKECRPENCPAEIRELDSETAKQRIVNLVCAWRDQLLEILSAMGLRDVRRLRGEVGRAMFYEEIEKECFDSLFDQRTLVK